MTDPFKLRALKAFTAALKTITPANGYTHDLSDFEHADGGPIPRVFRGLAWFGADSPIPMVSILEASGGSDDLVDMPQSAASQYDWPLLVQGFVADDPLNPTDPAYSLMADVRRCVAQQAMRKLPGRGGYPDPFGCGEGRNKVVSVHIGSGLVRPADDVSAKAYFWLFVTFRVVDHPDDPAA